MTSPASFGDIQLDDFGAARLPVLRRVTTTSTMDGEPGAGAGPVSAEYLERGVAEAEAELELRVDAVRPNDVSCSSNAL